MTTAPTTASTKIVVYWRRMKATAPSRIVPATACISGRAGVAGEHVAGEVDREQDGDDPGQRDDRQERTRIHQGRRVLQVGRCPASVPWRVSVRRRGRVSGKLPAGPDGMHRGLGPCRPAASVTRRSFGGSNSPADARICSRLGAVGTPPGPLRGGRRRRPLYCRTCEPTTRARVSLRDRRDARPDPHHLRRHPELRRTAVQGPAAVDGADPGA